MSLAIKTSPAPSYHIDDSDHSVDSTIDGRRLKRNVVSLITAYSKAALLGDDALIEAMARGRGFKAHDLAIQRIVLGDRRITLVCIPDGIWHQTDRMDCLFDLKREARVSNRTVILVPGIVIQRQPRLGAARAIEQAMGISVTADDRMAVLMHLIENGYSTLHDCACVVSCASPYSAILAMVGLGAINMDLSLPMTPASRIDLADHRGEHAGSA